jgi:hypothetical protein
LPSINLDIDYFNHPKTRRLVGLLGSGAAEYPMRIWCHCARYHFKDGVLADYTPEQLADVCAYQGDARKLLDSLVQVGFLERNKKGDLVAHDFFREQGHIYAFKVRAKKANRVRWDRIRAIKQGILAGGDNGNEESNEESLNDPSRTPLTVRYGTVRSGTETPTYSEPAQIAGIAASAAKASPPTALLGKGVMDTIATLAQAKPLRGAIEVAPDYKKPDTPLQKLLLRGEATPRLQARRPPMGQSELQAQRPRRQRPALFLWEGLEASRHGAPKT